MPMPTNQVPLHKSAPQDGPGTVLAVALLLLVLASALGTLIGDGELSRRSLTLHAGLAAVFLPLTLTVLLCIRLQSGNAAGWRAPLGGLALGALLLLPAVGWPDSKTLLVSFFPLIAGPFHPILLISAPAIFIAALLSARNDKGPRSGSDTLLGIRWLALPPSVSLMLVAWSWTATADVPPHIREEITAWVTGHSWSFTLSGIALWTWLQLAGIDGTTRRRWMIASVLPALSTPLAIGITGLDEPILFGRLAWSQLFFIGLAPSALAVAVLRDPIRRASGGWLWSSVVTLIAAWLTAVVLTAAANPALARLGALILLHGAGLALLIGLWAVFRLHRRPANGQFPVDVLARITVIGLAAGMVIGLAWAPPDGTHKKHGPADENTRRDVVIQRDREIAERFAQGVEMMRRREYGFAITAFHRVLELDPTLPDAHVNMGFSLYESGDLPGAQRFFESATRLNRNQLNAYYGLALAASARGQHEVASGAMRTWLHLAPPDDPFRARAEALFDQEIAKRRASPTARQESLPGYPPGLPR